MARKRRSAGHAIGGIIAGIEQQVFRTTPPANELVAKGARLRTVAAAGGGTIRVGLPGDPRADDERDPAARRMALQAPGRRRRDRSGSRRTDRVVRGRWTRAARDGRVRADRAGARSRWCPFAGRVRDGRFTFRGRALRAADRDAAARHPRVGPRSTVGAGRRPDHLDGAGAELAVPWPRRAAVRAGGRPVHVPPGAARRRTDARIDRLAPMVPAPADGRRGRRRRAGTGRRRAGARRRGDVPARRIGDRDGRAAVAPAARTVGRLLHRASPAATPHLARLSSS